MLHSAHTVQFLLKNTKQQGTEDTESLQFWRHHPEKPSQILHNFCKSLQKISIVGEEINNINYRQDRYSKMAQTGKEAQATDDGDPEVRRNLFSQKLNLL